MSKIELDYSGLDAAERNALKNALDGFYNGDFKQAYSIFLNFLNNGQKIKSLQYLIGLCLLRLNQSRLARLYIFREIQDFPGNKDAFQELLKENIKINGKTVNANFNQTKRPEEVPSISLVLIVKNEEDTLPKCLASFKDIVQEMIVVDTGSTDRTVEIAKSFGARVEYFSWNDNFAEARNVSLKYASCDWILRTDADEYIEDEEKAKLLHAANSGLAEIYICPTMSSLSDNHRLADNARLFRNHLGLKFYYPLHETLTPSAIELGLAQCITNIQFKHTGYDNLEKNDWELKIARNLRVCENYLLTDSENYYVRLIRGISLLNFKRNNEAIHEFEEILKNLPDNALGMRYLGLAYYCLANHYIEQKREIELVNIILDMQIDFYGITSMMLFVAEIYLYHLADWGKAEKLIVWTINQFDPVNIFFDVLPPDKYSKAGSLFHLMEVYVLQKNYVQAKKVQKKWINEKSIRFDQVTEKEPILDKEQDEQDQTRYESAGTLRQMAKKYKTQKEWQLAYETLIRAAAESQLSSQDYFDLASIQTQLGNTKFAQVLVNEAKETEPDSAIAANIESLIAIKEKNNQKALEKAVKAFITEPANSAYQNNVQSIAALIKLTPVEAIKEVGKKWLDGGQLRDGLYALTMYLKFQPGDEEIKRIIIQNTQ